MAMASLIQCSATSLSADPITTRFTRTHKSRLRCSLDANVSDMSVNAPKGLFPPEPEHYRGPKLKVAIIGAGLAGMSTAVELLDQGHEVDIYESRPFIGGKVGSFVDKGGNHIEMGLHVFFGCYNNLFRLLKKVGAENNLLVKDHTHTFVNKGGQIGELDFRFPIGAPIHGIRAFLTTNQLNTYDKARNAVALALSPVVRALVDPDGALRDIRNLDSISFSDWFLSKGGTRMSITKMWDPVAYALGFIDCDNISARCMLTIFALFATKTEASLLRMLKGSPDVYLSGPIRKYIMDRGGRFHLRWGCRELLYDKSADGSIYVTGLSMSKATAKKIVKADAYVAACDVPGIKRLLPSEWREQEFFNNIYELVGVPVVTVQLRYNGWVTELQDLEKSRRLGKAVGLDNLLYTPDADFSCFADLALSSPEDYYIEGQGSLLQCVLTPGDPYMPLPNDEIIARVAKQVLALFPSSQGLEVTWSSVVKIGQSLYREGPGKDPYRPDQKTPVRNFFLAGSYTKQDYIDSMEGATLSGRQASAYICDAGEELVALRKKLDAEFKDDLKISNTKDELSLFRRNHGVQNCSNTNTLNRRKIYACLNREKESETPQILKIAVSGVTELLRLFSPSSHQTSLEKQRDQIEFPASSVDDVLRIIKSDYDNAYFVTGRELYARNLKLLVPFFDSASIILQKIDKDVDSDTNFVLASWKLRTNLKLPWRPLISIDGSTVYELNEDYKIVRHVESWNISAVEAVLQIFSFKSKNPGG
ncbi:Zeta-carotene desaturase, chloroplastic/chromoplastic [Glycine soja]